MSGALCLQRLMRFALMKISLLQPSFAWVAEGKGMGDAPWPCCLVARSFTHRGIESYASDTE